MATEVINLTPFPHFKFSNSDNRGLEFGVVMLKVTFEIGEDGTCKIADEQEASNFKDLTHGEINKSSLRQPSELVGYKPKADIIVNATAHAPDGKPAGAWIAGIRVSDANGVRATKTLRITGPRFWKPKWKHDLTDDEKRNWKKHRDLFQAWELTEPQPISSLPIRYEYAYGGIIQTGQDEHGKAIETVFEYNPFGRGMINADWTDHTRPVPAPQLEYEIEPVIEPGRNYYPAGFGAIPPVWLPRRPLGGTFDKKWVDEIWPKWPPDYDFAYNNSAAAHLTAEGFLSGDIKVELINLHPERKRWVLTVPNPTPFIMALMTDGTEKFFRPALDTVFLDIDDPDSFEQRLTLIWRMAYHREETVTLLISRVDENEMSEVCEIEKISYSPHPASCATYSDALERPE